MTTDTNNARYQQVLDFMLAHDITFAQLADKLGFGSPAAPRYHLRNATCPGRVHRGLLGLGFPIEILPKVEDKKPGPARKVARWDDLAQQAEAQ